jgi:hypothetical protein
VASLVRARGKGFNDRASDGCASSANVPHTDVHPEFPSLRIPSAVIYQFFKVISDKLIEMGPTSGKFAAMWECTILDSGGRACWNSRRINHDKKQGMPDFQPDCPSARALCNLQFSQGSDETGRDREQKLC